MVVPGGRDFSSALQNVDDTGTLHLLFEELVVLREEYPPFGRTVSGRLLLVVRLHVRNVNR